MNASNRQSPYYIRPIDQELLSVLIIALKPPREIRRLPRAFTERNYWKAAEWRNFLLFYSPLLIGRFVQAKYFHHWMLLVYAMHVLMKSSITQSDIRSARFALLKFCLQTQSLYGVENMSYNVHILQHVCDSVENWGPLTFNSAFLYEDICGSLLNMLSGTQNPPHKIMKIFLHMRLMTKFSNTWLLDADSDVLELYENLTYFSQSATNRKLRNYCTVGKIVALVVLQQ